MFYGTAALSVHLLAELLDKPVHLEVYIKVRKGWSDREGALRDLGYE